MRSRWQTTRCSEIGIVVVTIAGCTGADGWVVELLDEGTPQSLAGCSPTCRATRGVKAGPLLAVTVKFPPVKNAVWDRLRQRTAFFTVIFTLSRTDRGGRTAGYIVPSQRQIHGHNFYCR